MNKREFEIPLMTSRQRVITALDHQEPDRVPFDCTFTYKAFQQITALIGFDVERNLQPSSPALNISPPVEFLQEMGIDLCYIGLNPWQDTPLFEYGMDVYQDVWGVRYQKVENAGVLEYPAVGYPLAEATIEDLADYPFPDPHAPELADGLAQRGSALFHEIDLALVGKFSTSIFEQAAALRGMERLYLDFIQDPEFIACLFSRLTDIAIGLIETGLNACGQYVQILRLAGDDMGAQQGTLFSPKMFRQMIKPYFARLYQEAKRMLQACNPGGKVMGHTDGNVYAIIPDYIEMGLDVLNPVQPYVQDMDHSRLKREFGSSLSFHGGMDLQNVLPFGTTEEVQAETRKVMGTLGTGGGFILAPTHYLLPDVPPENVLALREAVMAYGTYPLR